MKFFIHSLISFIGKDLSREFPKLTDDLRRDVAKWEESSGRKLIYGSESYLETMNKEKFSVDFELLHLRLLTKCQVLTQPIEDDLISIPNNSQSSPSTPLSSLKSLSSAMQKGMSNGISTTNVANNNRKLYK